ncbi:hypothetical protein BDV59DRAFT_210099 [Aspergillus ambiguus]|uniref:flavin-containing monooxygenase n=1 Tax=Aspergillus ambiguus TaxID=176160 RepID=UPI003CCDE4B3
MGSIEQNVSVCDAVIVGAGFSGTYGLHKLRKAGLSVKVFEAASDLGGVWYWNRYPGARVDSEWPYYQLTIPEVYQDFYFTQRFPDHTEIRRYFAHADKKLNLKKDIEFKARVTSATWDEASSRWIVRTDAGHVAVAKYLCLFTGLLHRQYTPDFPGFENYKGTVHHSSAWPADVDVTGKKVAVVGAGATSVQIVQELAKQAGSLAMFMRRPSHCLPMGNRTITEAEQDAFRPYYRTVFDVGRAGAAGFAIPMQTTPMAAMTDAEREAQWERLWRAGAFHFAAGQSPEVYIDRAANRTAYDFWAKKIRARMTDPVKRDLMAPLEPDYAMFTKRFPLEQDYYESLDRPNVEIVSLKKTPFKTFTENGVITEDGKFREFDYVVMATGFESFTGSIAMMDIRGKNGVNMKDVWKNGVRTYLGMVVNGFPNCFQAYTPQGITAPTALSNGPTIIECQIDWILETILKMEKDGVETLEPTTESEDQWIKMINEVASHTFYAETDSWWTGANVPGKKREMLTYLAGIGQYEKECHDKLDGWKGFEVKQKLQKSVSA